MILLKWSKYKGKDYYSDKDTIPYSRDIRELLTRPYKGLESNNFNKGIFDTVSKATDGEKIWLPITYSDTVKESLSIIIEDIMEDCTKGDIERLPQEKLDFLKFHSGGNPNESLTELLNRNKELFNYDISRKEYGSYLANEFYHYSQNQMNSGLTFDTKKFAQYFIEKVFLHSNGPDNKVLYFLIDMEDGLNNNCIDFAMLLSDIIENSKIKPNNEDKSFINGVLEEEYRDDEKEIEDAGEDEFEKFMENAEIVDDESIVNGIRNIILYDSKGIPRYSLTVVYNEKDDSVDTKLKRIKGEE